MTEHPSQYALDRIALGAPSPPEVTAHLARCATCASTVEARRTAEPPAPAWLGAVRVASAPPRAPRRRWLWLLPVPALAALGVALSLAVRPEQAGFPADTTREKAAPVVTVYVKRGGQVTAWDGRTPIRAGDRLRLGVRGAGYAHLSVASLPSPDAPVLLHAGPLAPSGETLLPLSFRVDGRGGAEVLSVIAGPAPVALETHAEPPERARARGVFAVRLQLPKEER